MLLDDGVELLDKLLVSGVELCGLDLGLYICGTLVYMLEQLALLQQIVDACQEHLAVEWLGDVGVCAMLIALCAVFLQVLGGEHDDRDVRGGGSGLELLGKLESVHHRHHHVADHQVGHLPARHLQTLLAVGSLDYEVGVLQQRALILAYVVVVVDDEYRGLVGFFAHQLLHLALLLVAVVDVLQRCLVGGRGDGVGVVGYRRAVGLMAGDDHDEVGAHAGMALHPCLAVVEFGERLDQSQSYARAACGALELEEPFKHLARLCAGDALARVAHIDAYVVGLGGERHMDFASCRSVFQCVADEVEHDARHFLLVGDHHAVGVEACGGTVHPYLLALGSQAEVVGPHPHRLDDVKAAEAKLHLAVLYLAEVEDIAHELL